jgi:hypothetical protein
MEFHDHCFPRGDGIFLLFNSVARIGRLPAFPSLMNQVKNRLLLRMSHDTAFKVTEPVGRLRISFGWIPPATTSKFVSTGSQGNAAANEFLRCDDAAKAD